MQHEKPAIRNILRKWYGYNAADVADAKRGNMHTDGFEDILEEFPPAFDCVKSLCREVRTPVRAQQQELCRAEVREISSDRSLVVLNDILAESVSDEYENDHLDDLMHKTVVEAVDERRGTIPMDVWKRNQVGEGSKIQQGDQISGNYRGQIPQNLRHHIAEDNKFGNNITFLQGN